MRSQNIHIFAYWYDKSWKQFVGATVKIADLAKNISDNGHKVILFLPKYHFKSLNRSIKIIEIPFINFPVLRSISFNLNLLFILLIFAKLKRPDVIYVRRMMSLVPLIYSIKSKASLFYEVNDDPYYYKDFDEKSLLVRLRSKISAKIDEINLKFCTMCFVITDSVKKRLLDYNPNLTDKNCILMPSGANIELFEPLDKEKCRNRLELDFKKKYIAFIGTLLKHQGIDVLISAASLILKKEPSSVFIIIGEGPMKERWIECVKKKKLEGNFIFTGQVDYENIPVWIGASDICVAPFKYSAGYRSPVKIFDYMSCARPVVASIINGTTDIFSNSGAISLVEPEQPVVLADAILDIINDDERAKTMGSNGRKLILEKYDRRILANKISNVAQDILGQKGHRI